MRAFVRMLARISVCEFMSPYACVCRIPQGCMHECVSVHLSAGVARTVHDYLSICPDVYVCTGICSGVLY